MNTAEFGRLFVQQDNINGIEERFEREVLGRLFLFFLRSSSRFQSVSEFLFIDLLLFFLLSADVFLFRASSFFTELCAICFAN